MPYIFIHCIIIFSDDSSENDEGDDSEDEITVEVKYVV